MLKEIEGGTKINIQGLGIWLPPLGYGCDIDTGEVKPVEIIKNSEISAEQKWQRELLPPEYESWVEDERVKKKYDKDYFNYDYENYKQREWHRRLNGIWIYVNGVPTYIPGSYYFFLNWWIIKEGSPSYRLVDLHYFYFWQYCVEDAKCFGMIQMTKRRGAKTVKAACILFERVSRTENSKGGIQSKKKDPDAKDFYDIHIISPFQKLPEFYIPVYDTMMGTKPANKLSFVATSVRGKESLFNLNNEQLKSEIDFRESEALAYDGTNLFVLINDERGKVNFDLIQAHLVVRKCVMDLRGKITGKMIVCTTVEEIGVKARFPELWRMSDQYKKEEGKATESGLYRLFTAADEAGDWDEYGVPYTFKNRMNILESRRLLEGDSKALIDEIRKDPLDEREAFMILNSNCHFDPMLLNEMYQTAKPISNETIEYGNYYWKDGIPFGESLWENCDKSTARWQRCKSFKVPDGPKVEWRGNMAIPLCHIQFISGCDPFQNDITEETINSKASSGVLNRFEDGTNDIFFDKIFPAKYHYRPKMAKLFHMDMVLQCFHFGCQILVEAKMDGGLRKYFEDNGLAAFLIYLPDKTNAGIDPNQDNKVLLLNCWEEWIITHGKEGKMIYPDVIDDEKDGLLKFNVNETEVSNQVMGLGWTLVADFFKRANFRKKEKPSNVSDWFPKRKSVA